LPTKKVLTVRNTIRNGNAPEMTSLTILGIESSCDDTAAAVLRGRACAARILSSVVMGQTALHANFGGVVPEIAARAHAEKLDICVQQALDEAHLDLGDIDAVAVTAGPGLIGGVVSGVMCAKGIALARGIPLYGVNHLAGHALTPRLTDSVSYPYLMLLVSGGHCQFLIVSGPDTFQRLGGTIDDAPGEAFDKVARLIALPQPGGPSIEARARAGDPERFRLPRPLLDREGCDMSFSGLKTAVLRQRDSLLRDGALASQDQADLAAGFQAAVVDVLAEKTRRALHAYATLTDTPSICVAGGVAANMAIRSALQNVAAVFGAAFIAPPLALCTDNAAMIAYAALEQMGHRAPDGMDLSARPRWPLDKTAPAMLGSGKKGAKA
jgi:N6-L-threonylcarbamoyladenine synthase